MSLLSLLIHLMCPCWIKVLNKNIHCNVLRFFIKKDFINIHIRHYLLFTLIPCAEM